MENIEFIKMHGLGNDFVIIDQRINKIKISKKIINKLSDRKSGAGCDQLITINDNTCDDHDVYIQIYNANGDRAEACGNGTRCVAKLLFDEKNNDWEDIAASTDINHFFPKAFAENGHPHAWFRHDARAYDPEARLVLDTLAQLHSNTATK